MTARTKSAEMAADVTALLRSRNPVLWIVTREEARVEGHLFAAGAAAGFQGFTWDVAAGVCDMAGKPQRMGSKDPGETMEYIAERANGAGDRAVWIMRDLPAWLVPPIGITTCRQLRNLARLLPGVGRKNAQAVIVITPSGDVPPELQGHATVIDWPLPDREEIASILDAAVNSLPDEIKATAASNGTRETAIDAAVGLSGEEAAACYARSLVQLRRIEPTVVAREKKRVIARERVLEWHDPLPGGLSAVGGLDQLKAWLQARKAAYSPRARAYGLPTPKGVLLCGHPGTGKSLTAKAVATAWEVPLLRLDLGALKSKFVGDSEANLRRALRVIEAIGPCVIWLEEIEKALAGAMQGAADGGVSSDALGTVLTWMSERLGQAFIVASANAIDQLPPEMLRKGRFDEIFFLDLPTEVERISVLYATLRKHGRGDLKVDATRIAVATEGFTGAEIAEIVPDAMFVAFNDGEREITTDDLVRSAALVVPLAKSASEKIAKLRDWAKGRARSASLGESASAELPRSGRVLDLE